MKWFILMYFPTLLKILGKLLQNGVQGHVLKDQRYTVVKLLRVNIDGQGQEISQAHQDLWSACYGKPFPEQEQGHRLASGLIYPLMYPLPTIRF